MIRPVCKLCTACMGLGKIEHRSYEGEQLTPIDENITEKIQDCYLCNGKGYILTGEFTFINKPEFKDCSLSELLTHEPEWVRNIIYKKPE